MPVQAATHWDAIGHIFHDDKMYNGFDAREADCNGLGKLGIEHTKSRMVGRGVLLDIARFRGVDWLKDGEGISNDELDTCAKEANVRSGAAISSSCAPGRWSAAWPRGNGAPMPAAMRRE